MIYYTIHHREWFRLPNDPDEKDFNEVIDVKTQLFDEAMDCAIYLAHKNPEEVYDMTLWDDTHPITATGTLNFDMFSFHWDEDTKMVKRYERHYGMEKAIEKLFPILGKKSE